MEHLRSAFFRLTSLVVIPALIFGVVSPAWALAPAGDYQTMTVSLTGGGTLQLKPGETKKVTAEFKNTGAKTWARTGNRFVSVYTYKPKYRSSVFESPSWKTPIQPALLTETTVKPGEIGHVSFALTAPQKKGAYTETFQLAAENISWITGSLFTFSIQVADTPVAPVAAPPAPADPVAGLSATVLIRSAKTVSARAGEEVRYTVGIKNTGLKTWNVRELRTLGVGSSAGIVTAKVNGPVDPGTLDYFDFVFHAPSTKGTQTFKYTLAVDGQPIPDFSFDVPVETTTSAPEIYQSPVTPGTFADSEEIMDQPTVRVGVLIVDGETQDQVQISCASPWKLLDTNGALLAEMADQSSATVFYKQGKYWFNRGLGLETTSFPLRFVPASSDSICTVQNFDQRVTRHSAYADNTFRGTLELRYNATKARTWLINELPMETYLHGLGETSNDSNGEYQKALVVAARTYALTMWQHGTKHAAEGFQISAYADDQVYGGEGHERRSPTLVQSVDATRGRILTYGGDTALTPYFSSSDGRTRAWGEVWAGNVPWLVSVPAPCDASRGRSLRGHGVGMSASEALCQGNQGKGWRDILNYFYPGTNVTLRWN